MAIPIHWYAWQMVYSHDVIDTSDNFHFFSIGEKGPPILLQIEVDLLSKYLNIIHSSGLSSALSKQRWLHKNQKQIFDMIELETK